MSEKEQFIEELKILFDNFIVIPKTYRRDKQGNKIFDYEYMERIFNEQLEGEK
jgi:hypothetical protein